MNVLFYDQPFAEHLSLKWQQNMDFGTFWVKTWRFLSWTSIKINYKNGGLAAIDISVLQPVWEKNDWDCSIFDRSSIFVWGLFRQHPCTLQLHYITCTELIRVLQSLVLHLSVNLNELLHLDHIIVFKLITWWTLRIFFIFVCSGEGKGESEVPGGGRGATFYWKSWRGGGLPDGCGRWGEGPGGCFAGIGGGGGLNIFFSGQAQFLQNGGFSEFTFCDGPYLFKEKGF